MDAPIKELLCSRLAAFLKRKIKTKDKNKNKNNKRWELDPAGALKGPVGGALCHVGHLFLCVLYPANSINKSWYGINRFPHRPITNFLLAPLASRNKSKTSIYHQMGHGPTNPHQTVIIVTMIYAYCVMWNLVIGLTKKGGSLAT